MPSRLAVVLLCLAPLSHAFAQTPAPNPLPRMQQIIHSYTDDKTFMGTVLVVKNGNALIDQGYGSADLEWSIPNSPDTRFRLGSITKQFTAASILLLAKRGKLNIDDPISKYLPDAPPAETKFFLKVVDAEIEFFRDSATHAINRLILYQGDVQHEGKK